MNNSLSAKSTKEASYMTNKKIKDMWNAFMVKNATWSPSGIPLCRSTTSDIPKNIITYSEAKSIYAKEIRKSKEFHNDSFVCFYEHDQFFDGYNGIWFNPKKAYSILSHFEGIIAPDFSTYSDFPKPLRLYNYYRMNAFGHWYGQICGKKVIVNARWNYRESFSYCFDGIKENEIIVAIGTVGSNLKRVESYYRFINGLEELIKSKKPKKIIIYGGLPVSILNQTFLKNIEIIRFQSKTDKAFKRFNHE